VPVYLITIHAYRSWSEGNPRGYVQRGQGLQKTNERLARWRADNARQEPARFSGEVRNVISRVVDDIAVERKVRLHARAATGTHVHVLISFGIPACTCGASKFCGKGCEARRFVEAFTIRLKRKMGQAVAKFNETSGRQWFSRGWDLTRIRDREHFDFMVGKYLPRHEGREGGLCGFTNKKKLRMYIRSYEKISCENQLRLHPKKLRLMAFRPCLRRWLAPRSRGACRRRLRF
jgi:hypothetical protein